MDDDFAKDLDAWLNATSDRYVVDQTLKSTPYETTQIVYKRNEQGGPSFGPFVRKVFDKSEERGMAYEQLLLAQTQGRHLEHLPWVYECEHTGDHLEVVMEYLQGETLREYAGLVSPGTKLAAHVVPQLCDAVTELHESFATPLIHRDIKPSNIMICDGQVKLIDLGIARAYRADATCDTERYGTPGYAPPEQFGYEQTNVRSDVYTLGMTTAFCLIGEDPTADLREHAFVDPRIPAPLQVVLAKATQFDPNNRYGSARELKQAFGKALNENARYSTATARFMFNDFDAGTRHVAPAAAAGHVAPATAPVATPSAETSAVPNPPAQAQPLIYLGLVWDILLGLIWLLWVIIILVGSQRVKNAPLPMVYLLSIFCIIIPSTCLVFPLLDKRLFRDKIPFLANMSKGKEVLCCVVLGATSFIAFAIVFMAWMAITHYGK